MPAWVISATHHKFRILKTRHYKTSFNFLETKFQPTPHILVNNFSISGCWKYSHECLSFHVNPLMFDILKRCGPSLHACFFNAQERHSCSKSEGGKFREISVPPENLDPCIPPMWRGIESDNRCQDDDMRLGIFAEYKCNWSFTGSVIKRLVICGADTHKLACQLSYKMRNVENLCRSNG